MCDTFNADIFHIILEQGREVPEYERELQEIMEATNR